MSVKMRQIMERRIASVLIRDALAAGYTISVYDGEETTLKQSTSRKDILAAMFSVDEEFLFFYKDGKRVGWVQFVLGNSGWDVISDYTTNLEHIMTGATKMSEKYQ